MTAVLGLVVPSLDRGGGVPAVARFVLAAAQGSGRFRVELISLAMSSSDECSTRLLEPASWVRGVTIGEGVWRGSPFRHVGARWVDFEFQRYRPRPALAKAVAECDLLQVVCGSPAWANALVGLGKPVSLQVATCARVERRRRNFGSRSLAGWWRKAMTEITDRFDDRALRRVDAIQVENAWMLEYARRLNAGRQDVDIRYAHPGVDTVLFHPLRHRDLSTDPYILCVGRLDDPRKNIVLLLEAFQYLSSSLRRVQLVTAGWAAPPEAYWDRVQALGLAARVRHIARPSTDELVRLYQQAKVFALASDEEGLGVVILEAMSCGVPVVSTRSGGPNGIITEGVDGYLVPLDDAHTLADRLARLLTDDTLNREMAYVARRTIESRFAEEVAGRIFVDVWNRLLCLQRAPAKVRSERRRSAAGT